MHLTCDCYCKTRVPFAQQRREIHSDRVAPSSKSSTTKPEVIRRAKKKVPLTPAKLVDDEELDNKRSTVTFPVSPSLSPETTVALENTERLIKNAEIQIKEISSTGNLGRVQNCLSTWPDETFLNDENNQLLYIRERVAYKFQEANGWIDSNRLYSGSQTSFHERLKPKRSTDFSDPKYRTSEERYQEFLQLRRLQSRNFEFPAQTVEDAARSTKAANDSNKTRPADRGSTKNTKINSCSVHSGLSVDIRSELTAQNLKSVHISPDTSFVQEKPNIGTFEIDYEQKNPPSVRRQKFVKILEENGTTNDKKNTRNSMATEETQSSGSSTSVCKKAPEDVAIETSEAPQESIQQINLKVDAEEDVGSNLNDLDGKLEETGNTSKNKQDVDESKMAVEAKSDHKQVRFEPEALEKEEKKQEEYSSALKDDKNEHTPLSIDETETRHLMNKRRHEEVCGKRKCRLDEGKIVNQRFCDVLKKYCDREANLSSRFTESSSSEDLSSLGELYEPSMDQFDDLLTEYCKIINNVVQSTETIDKFLSRPEYSKGLFQNREEMARSSLARPTRRRDFVRHKSSSTNKNINTERQRRMKPMSVKFIKGDNNSRKPLAVLKRPNKAGRTDSTRNKQTELLKNEDITDGHKIKDLEENCTSKELVLRSLPVVPAGSSSSLSSFSSLKSEGVNEGKVFQAADARNAEENDLDYAMLYDVVCSKVLKDVLPETNNMERSILRVLREETRFIEQKIKSVFNVDEIVPVLAKGLLEHLKNNVSSFEPDDAEGQMKKKSEDKEENLINEDNFNVVKMMKDTACGPSVSSSSSNSKNEVSSNEDNNKVNSNSLKDSSKTNSGEISLKNNVKDVVSLKEDKGLSSTKSLLQSCEENKNVKEQNVNKEEIFEDFDKSSGLNKDKGIENVEQEDCIDSNKTALVSEVREENQISSSNSLKDCASLQSSRSVSKMSNIVEPLQKVNEAVQMLEINNETTGGTINANKLDFDTVFEKDKILSEVYEDVHKKIFSSTFNTNYSSAINQNWRWSSSVSAIGSKVLTSSSSSRSEGELHVPSSGSYSAGEVRMLTKNRSDGENTDDDIMVFLTEQTLTSWNESSKALVQSIGEI